MLDYEKAKRTFRYEPETGKLFWAESRPREDFTTVAGCNIWNGQFAGKEVACRHNCGYLKLCLTKIDGKRKEYLAHRVIWLLTTGDWPENDIDHIDGNRSNNRISNLRTVTRAENMKNKSMPSNNKSGTIGVCWTTKRGRWLATITVGRKTRRLGEFVNKEDAISARKKAEVELNFHDGHGRKLQSVDTV